MRKLPVYDLKAFPDYVDHIRRSRAMRGIEIGKSRQDK